jgi:hypothetical protein
MMIVSFREPLREDLIILALTHIEQRYLQLLEHLHISLTVKCITVKWKLEVKRKKHLPKRRECHQALVGMTWTFQLRVLLIVKELKPLVNIKRFNMIKIKADAMFLKSKLICKLKKQTEWLICLFNLKTKANLFSKPTLLLILPLTSTTTHLALNLNQSTLTATGSKDQNTTAERKESELLQWK